MGERGGKKQGAASFQSHKSAHTDKKIIQDHQIGETRFQVLKGTGSWRIWLRPLHGDRADVLETPIHLEGTDGDRGREGGRARKGGGVGVYGGKAEEGVRGG